MCAKCCKVCGGAFAIFCWLSVPHLVCGVGKNRPPSPATPEEGSYKLKTDHRAKLLIAGRGCLSLSKAPLFAKDMYYMQLSLISKKKIYSH